MASPPIILSESSKPVKNRPISPTCFFKEAFALDTKGKALLNAMELYYPPSGVIIAESSKHTVEKKKAATSNRQRVLQKNQRLDLPALEENLPTKRKRQAKIKSDDTYYCSPINKRTKSVAIDSFGEHCEMKDGEKIVSAIYPDTNILAADLNVNVRKQNMAIVQKLIDFGIAKGQICNLISVNALVLQKWLDDSTKDINPGTINRLNDSISIWLSVLSMEDITILKFSRTAQIPSAIVDKLLSTNNFNLKSADVEAVHCDNIRHPLKYNQISFLLKENLQQRAQVKFSMLLC